MGTRRPEVVSQLCTPVSLDEKWLYTTLGWEGGRITRRMVRLSGWAREKCGEWGSAWNMEIK